MGGMFVDHGGRKGHCGVTNIILVVSATNSFFFLGGNQLLIVENLKIIFLPKKNTEFSYRIMVKLKFLIRTFDEKKISY